MRVEGTEVHLHESGGEEDAPLLVWLGDALGPGRSRRAEERLARDLAARSGWSVASVGYAPDRVETFPRPLTRAYRCLVHLQARREGGPVAIGGAGFGAGLAAATSILAQRYGDEPVAARILLAPLLDARLASPSWRRPGSEADRRAIEAALADYAPGLDRADPLLSPLLAESVDRLPPTVIVTAERDPMRDDGERYAQRLGVAGVTVLGHRYPRTDHRQACGGVAGGEGDAVLKGVAAAMRMVLSRPTDAHPESSSRPADASQLTST